MHPPHAIEHMIDCADHAWDRLNLRPPCNLRDVCDFLNISVERQTLPNDVFGMFVRTPQGNAVIVLNAGLPLNLLRFTWAHEIGHAISTKGTTIHRYRAGFLEEQLCSQFARHLLVPSPVLIAECERLGHPGHNRFGALREIFEVSSELLGDRLIESGMDRRKPVCREGRIAAVSLTKEFYPYGVQDGR